MSLPACEVAANLWSDEDHVARHRAAVRHNWKLADRHLGDLPGYRRPPAGFFLWLPVEDDERCALALWQKASLRAMPGRYLAHTDPDGRNPGMRHLRIALIHEPAKMETALRRLCQTLTI